jgi:hypothetical protein
MRQLGQVMVSVFDVLDLVAHGCGRVGPKIGALISRFGPKRVLLPASLLWGVW